MSFEPAYDIPLTDQEFAYLGQLVATMGQAEEEMILCVSGLIHADRPTTERVMGSGSMAVKSSIWAAFVKLRSDDDNIHKWVDHAMEEIGAVPADRNSYVHANWRLNVGDAETPMFYRRSSGHENPLWNGKGGTATATRTQNSAITKPVTELLATVDRANRLSQVIAHITARMCADSRDGPSTWLDRLGGQPPERSQKAEARKAKEPKPLHLPLNR